MESQSFTKYEKQGAYHWECSSPKSLSGLRKFSPRLVARYQIVLNALRSLNLLQEDCLGLDVGCGDGIMSYKIDRAGGNCWGIDGESSAIKAAEEQYAKKGFKTQLIQGNVYQLPYEDQFFDYAISLDVIEHLKDPDVCLFEIQRCLKPSGIAIFTTPMEIEAGKVQDRFHEREYTLETLQQLLLTSFYRVEVKGYNPRWIDNLFLAKRQDIVPRSLAWAIKISSAFFWNPVEKLQGYETQKYADILAICYKLG
jgi:ubiquinone/menaquinone biosynthesis C-methylase UbiE